MKKKILSFICTLCLILPCALIFSGCSIKKIKSYAFYLNSTKIENSALSYTYGETPTADLENVSLQIVTKKETLTYKLADLTYTLSYNDFEETTTLQALPTEWNAGIYSFACNVSTNYGDVSATLSVTIKEIDYGTTYSLSIGESTTECTLEYDNSPMLENDPVLTFFAQTDGDPQEVSVTYNAYYITNAQYSQYLLCTTPDSKINFLNNNKTAYNGTYQMAPAIYYMFAVVKTPQNYLNIYTNLVKCTITNMVQDYSMLEFTMDYTFDPANSTDYHTSFAQVVEAVGMPTIDEFEGKIEWVEDYSYLQLICANSPYTLKLKITPSNPYITYTKTEFDVTLHLHKGLIRIPTLKEEFTEFPNFVYDGTAQGLTIENGADIFDNWFSATDLNVVNGNFETHTNAGNYTLTVNLPLNPNFAFTDDGETECVERSITLNWGIDKADSFCYVNDLHYAPQMAVNNETRITLNYTLPDTGKITLPTLSQFHGTPFCATDPTFEIITENEEGVTYGTATIEGNELVVSSVGTIVVKISHTGNENIKALEIVIVYEFES